MQATGSLRNIGQVVERCIYRTTVYWVRRNQPGTELHDAMAQHIRAVETVITQRPGGRVDITTSVLARRKHLDETQHFRYQRTGISEYVHRADTLPEV